MKTFRGTEVVGWKIIEEQYTDRFEDAVNKLMEKYDFEDFQFSTMIEDGFVYYTAAILLREKVNVNKKFLGN